MAYASTPTGQQIVAIAEGLARRFAYELLPAGADPDWTPITVRAPELEGLLVQAVGRGIEIGRQHAATTTEEK